MAIIYHAPFSMCFKSMHRSIAFKSLSKNAMYLLLFALEKRKKDTRRTRSNKKRRFKDYVFKDDPFTLTYKYLEKELGFHKMTTSRSITELLEKGFLEKIFEGGTYRGLSNQYIHSGKFYDWEPGIKFYKKPKDVQRGFQGNNNNNLKQNKTKLILKRKKKNRY